MLGARAEPAQGLDVVWRTVTFVACEAVFGVARVEFHQQAVPLDLRDDRGERDGEALAVAALDGLVGPGERPQRQAVDEHEHVALVGAAEEFTFRARRREESRQRTLGQLRDATGHRQARRAQDVVGRDLQHRRLRPHGAQLAFGGHLRDPATQFGALLGRQLFRVVSAGQASQPGRLAVEPGVEQHRARDDRSAERPAAGLVDARDARTSGAASAVEGGKRRHWFTPPSCGGRRASVPAARARGLRTPS